MMAIMRIREIAAESIHDKKAESRARRQLSRRAHYALDTCTRSEELYTHPDRVFVIDVLSLPAIAIDRDDDREYGEMGKKRP